MTLDVRTQAELDAALAAGHRPRLVGDGHFTVTGSSSVVAWGSSSVEAWGSSSVEARESSSVVARQPDEAGVVILFKAVDANWRGPHGGAVTYEPGSEPAALDWDGGTAECGRGLHFSPHPRLTRGWLPEPAHYVGCPVKVADIAAHGHGAQYPGKVKAPACCGPVFEVTIDGEPVAPAAKPSRKKA